MFRLVKQDLKTSIAHSQMLVALVALLELPHPFMGVCEGDEHLCQYLIRVQACLPAGTPMQMTHTTHATGRCALGKGEANELPPGVQHTASSRSFQLAHQYG